MGAAALGQLILEVFVVVSPAVDGFSGDADGFGDLGIGFTGDDEGDSEQLLVFQGLLLGFVLGLLLGVPFALVRLAGFPLM